MKTSEFISWTKPRLSRTIYRSRGVPWPNSGVMIFMIFTFFIVFVGQLIKNNENVEKSDFFAPAGKLTAGSVQVRFCYNRGSVQNGSTPGPVHRFPVPTGSVQGRCGFSGAPHSGPVHGHPEYTTVADSNKTNKRKSKNNRRHLVGNAVGFTWNRHTVEGNN